MIPERFPHALRTWVEGAARVAQPERVVWWGGSAEERRELIASMLRDRTLIELRRDLWPDCYLHRSHPDDVARTERLTFIASEREEDAGPLNNWMSPEEAERTVAPLFRGCMRGRTLFVVPYLLGPPGCMRSGVGVQITDSPYVVLSLSIMVGVGEAARKALSESPRFVKGLHSLGDLNPERRYIVHFPERREIWSVGSGYGGNALLPKKCHALRIASVQARDEGWLAEHMLIVGVENPRGDVRYLAAAFPSACGKTNLAMLVPPPSQAGFKVWTVGDDIAWLWLDQEGRLRAINPESGFFGVLRGTNSRTNPNAMATIRARTIFTNAALTPDGSPWWEGADGPVPDRLTDWQGREWSPQSGYPAAHPNARFTAPLERCPSISPRWNDPEGVPISAIIFGGRRASLVPLVYETFSWEHGVYTGASMASETTAAAEGEVGRLRRDPMAMRPFCGYHIGDYFRHWLEFGRQGSELPKIFHVNWFRTDASGRYLWPGFGENLRVLRWILARSVPDAFGEDERHARAKDTPIGRIPASGALDLTGLDLSPGALRELLRVDRDAWRAELEERRRFFEELGGRIPEALYAELEAEERRLDGS